MILGLSIESSYFIILAMMLGASWGSFFAAVIYRIPRNISLIYPRSQCEHCGRSLKFYHMIPIISYLMLRGRCSDCQVKIGLRCLFLEVLFSLLAVVIFIKFGLSFSSCEKYLFAALLITIAYIDMDTMYIPNSLIVCLILLGIISIMVYFWQPELYKLPSTMPFLLKNLVLDGFKISLTINKIAGACIGFLILFLIGHIATRIMRSSGRIDENQWAMGDGDAMLAMAIGLFVGLHIFLVIFLASVLGSIYSIFLKLFAKSYQKDSDIPDGALPFAPFLAISAIFIYVC